MLDREGIKLDGKALFGALCRHLQKKGRLARVIEGGLTSHGLARSVIDIARAFVKQHYSITIKRQLASRGAVPLPYFWWAINTHLHKNGSGSVILGLGGCNLHWTCVKLITNSRIVLEDSDHLKYLNRKTCTTGNPRSGRHHRLCPDETWLLKL
jgi:hypothetical protein